jgi:hypothetical protein
LRDSVDLLDQGFIQGHLDCLHDDGHLDPHAGGGQERAETR